MQFGPALRDGAPEDRIQRLEGARTPGRQREPSARAHVPPQRAHGRGHVGDEEDPEHAHHGVEGRLLEAESEQVAGPELRVAEAARARLLARARQEVLDGWNAYASRGEVVAKFQQTTTAADDLSQQLLDREIVELSEACYTDADRAQADSDSDQASTETDG